MLNRIEQVAQFVHGYLMETGQEHLHETWGAKYRWEHTLRVANWAMQLAGEEKVDVEKCIIAALFHDVSHFVSDDYRKHGDKSAEIARDFLRKRRFPQDFIEDVTYSVTSHVGEHHPKTVEAKILQDADTLDRFGYIRILLFGKTAELADLKKLEERVQSFSDYLAKVEHGDFGEMWTKTGKEKLRELVNTNRMICNGILEELANTKHFWKNP